MKLDKTFSAMATAAALLAVSSLSADAWASGGHGSRSGAPGFRPGAQVRTGVPAFRPGRVGHPGFRSVHGFGGHPRFRGHHGGRSRVFIGSSLFLGGPVWWGAPAWGPSYVAPPVIFHQTPTVYVPASPPPAYWYYCAGSQTYYPYVQECPGGWTPVVPTPTE